MTDQLIYYFPEIDDIQKQKLSSLGELYSDWNKKVNVISRKDIVNFDIRHVLHSLSIAKVFQFPAGSKVLDVGTGGGFPGIPLAILFPDTEFTLLDSTRKKINVVTEISRSLSLQNVIPVWKRAEDEKGTYHFIVSRAVTEFNSLVNLTKKNINNTASEKGIIALKGGDLTEELKGYSNIVKTWNIIDFFKDSFFETKKIIYLPF
ncbi:MAG TPA: 16S rRNA (guanine(527)-N(7))-methyltransferase RsmG [Bacteroidales bacterium]|nr:16S rRNA (guanine(527)-N(7))-methyltransferase RsmG [Bacteroidales bacterium]